MDDIKIEQLINEIDITMSMSNLPLTEEHQECIRRIIRKETSADYEVYEIIKKYKEF